MSVEGLNRESLPEGERIENALRSNSLEKKDGLVCRPAIKDDDMPYGWFLSKNHVFGCDWLPKPTCDCETAATVDVAAGIVEETWAGIVAPNASVRLTPTVGVTCEFCCEVTSNVAFATDGFDGLDCKLLLCVLRTISRSCFLFLKNMHNKNQQDFKRNKLLRKMNFLFVYEIKNTNGPTGRANLFTLVFFVNNGWFRKWFTCKIN